VGKRTTADEFAKTLLCEGELPPCENCYPCTHLKEHPDFLVTTPKKGEDYILLEDTKEVKEILPYPPLRGSVKIWVIDPVELLTPQATNSLLLLLEEPYSFLWIVGITHSLSRVPVTLRSRALKIPFHPLPPSLIEEISPSLPPLLKNLGSMEGAETLGENFVPFLNQWEEWILKESYDPQGVVQWGKKLAKRENGVRDFFLTLLRCRSAIPFFQKLPMEKKYGIMEVIHEALLDLERNVNVNLILESTIRKIREIRKRTQKDEYGS